MLIGMDVGGTYTDGTAVSPDGEIVAAAKYPTVSSNLLESLTGCIDQLLKEVKPESITRVVISTTLLTNAILQGNLDPIGLMVIPGPGLKTADFTFGAKAKVLRGAIDFRGREIRPLDMGEVAKVAQELVDEGCQGVAVVGKFAQRNNCHELQVETFLKRRYPNLVVELGHRINGNLNFPRRVDSTFLTAATRGRYWKFLQQVESTVRSRRINAPLFVLKADGGTLPLAAAALNPVESIYSGPAASVLGVMALSEPGVNTVVMDIGGTTTDLGLILGGKPLLSAKGAEIGPYKTQVRSLAVSSAPVGGDTAVEVREGRLFLTATRRGRAYCLGGTAPTPTDALRFLELIDHGAQDLAREAMEQLAKAVGKNPRQTAEEIVNLVVERIAAAFTAMVKRWENEPVYRVWQVLHPRRLDGFSMVGVGGPSQGLTPLVAARLRTGWRVPGVGAVANALGAAVARPTFSTSLRVDTVNGVYSIAETGEQLPWHGGKGSLDQAVTLLEKHFGQRAVKLELEDAHGEITRKEIFNVVRGFSTEGKIIEVAMEQEAGVLTRLQGGEQ